MSTHGRSQILAIAGRRDSGERMKSPSALNALDMGINTVRLAPKPTVRADPLKRGLVTRKKELCPNSPCRAVNTVRQSTWPRTVSRLEAASSSNSIKHIVHFKPRGVGCTNVGISASRAQKDTALVLTQPVCNLLGGKIKESHSHIHIRTNDERKSVLKKI